MYWPALPQVEQSDLEDFRHRGPHVVCFRGLKWQF